MTPDDKKAKLRKSKWVPFSEENFGEYGSGVDNPYYNESMADYYLSLDNGFPNVCCGKPTSVHGHVVHGEMVGEPIGYYCRECNTFWRTGAGGFDKQEAAFVTKFLKDMRSTTKWLV